MADDWIKLRKKLARDGRVLQVSRKCHAARVTVLGALVVLWSLADDYAEEDGRFPGYTPEDLDRETELPGFAAALPPDWFEVRGGTIYLPNYQEHNGETAKKRAQAAQRKQRQRGREKDQENVSRTQRDKSVTRGEERRIEEANASSPPGEPAEGESKPTTPKKPRPPRARPSAPRPRDDLWDAVVEVTGSDPKASARHIGSTCKALRAADPPYTAAEVRSLPAILSARHFSLPLTLGTVTKYVGWSRKTPRDQADTEESVRARVQAQRARDREKYGLGKEETGK